MDQKKNKSNTSFHFKKKFGQNFLKDANIARKIVKSVTIDDTTNVIEIGPGQGALTKHLVKSAHTVLAYEIDTDLKKDLNQLSKENPQLVVVFADILKRDIEKDIIELFPVQQRTIVVANLPYYITTPILMGLLEKTKVISEYCVMTQKEVADRLTANYAKKEYNALSIAIQYRASAKKIMQVPRSVFIPAPNVDSAVVHIKLYEESPYPPLENEAFFFEMIRACFAQRRKTLMNNLIHYYGQSREFWQSIYESLEDSIPLSARADALPVKVFVDLANALSAVGSISKKE